MTTEDRRGRRVGTRTRRRLELRRRTRRSMLLTVAAILPGAGLTRTRFKGFGWTLLALLAVVVIGTCALVVAKGPRTLVNALLRVALDPGKLLLLLVGVVAVGLVWVVSIVLTNRGSEPADADPSQRVGLRLLTGLMCVVVALPLVQGGRYILIQRQTLDTVFAGTAIAPRPGVTQTAVPTADAVDPWANIPRVNMLLIGSDAGSDRTGLRTDSMVVVSINTKTGATVLVSIPRNLERAPFPVSNPLHNLYPRGYYCPNAAPGAECLINAVWELAEEHKDEFPGDPSPGLTTIRGVLEQVTGLTIDYSTIIDLEGFQALVDAMGGVYVNNTERLPINGYHLSNGGVAGIEGYIEPGYQKLDGFHALWYARSRLLSDDYSRMRRQRCLIGALVDQVNPATMLTKYPQLAKVAQQNIVTDVAVADLPAWVELVERIQSGGIRSIAFTYDVINVVNPDYDKIHAIVQAAINPPPVATSTPSGGSTPSTSTTSPSTSRPTTTTPVPDSTTAVDVKQAC